MPTMICHSGAEHGPFPLIVTGGRLRRPSRLLLAGVQFPCWASVYSNDDGPSGIMIKTDRRAQRLFHRAAGSESTAYVHGR
jgi:hypothetical protein